MRVTVESTERGARASVRPQRLRELARRTITVAGLRPRVVALSVAFIDQQRSAAVNRRYRGKNRPTNVLSFRFDHPGTAHELAGEILLCPPVIRAEVRASGQSLAAASEELFVHGLLHVLGYHHARAADEQVMTALTRQALHRSP